MVFAYFPNSSDEEDFEFSDKNRKELERIVEKYPVKRSALIPALILVQKQEGKISSKAMQYLASYFETSAMEIWSVVSFYTMLKTNDLGKFHFQVCDNLSCALLGAGKLIGFLEKRLDCLTGKTRSDKKFSIERVECLGACGGAPCLIINTDYFENMTAEILEPIITSLEKGEAVIPRGADEVALNIVKNSSFISVENDVSDNSE